MTDIYGTAKPTFAERCQLAEQCLPDAPYRAMLKKLHTEMLEALTEQPAQQEPWADKCRIDLVTAIHFLASDFENALGAFGSDTEARRKAEGDIAYARIVASRWNWNGTTEPAQQSAERVEPVDWEAVAADQAMTIALLKAEQPAQQQPVAYLVDGDLYYPEEIDWETLQEQGHTVAALYTSLPAQRKPLTLGQKQRLWSSVGDKPTLKDRVNAYGLAIEAAHGIKENT